MFGLQALFFKIKKRTKKTCEYNVPDWLRGYQNHSSFQSISDVEKPEADNNKEFEKKKHQENTDTIPV